MFNRRSLDIDPAAETEKIRTMLLSSVRRTMRRNGAVVGVSGGIDSSVTLALCARAFGPERVLAVSLPERESDTTSEPLARELARTLGVEFVVEDITAALDGFGCYRRRDEAIRRAVPEYDPARGYKAKITLPPDLLDREVLSVFSVTVVAPDGGEIVEPLNPADFRQIVAASNFKQRARMAALYYHAELRNYAVAGTANKNERDFGFFVKYGDGGVDVGAIEHLYKTQVYQLAEYLGIPEPIRRRTPTTDTYPAPATQQEFFFRLPFEMMDLICWAMEHGATVSEVARQMDLTEEQVARVHHDFIRKRRAAEYLRLKPVSLAATRNPAAPDLAAAAESRGEP
jgi:NAD+ synthase